MSAKIPTFTDQIYEWKYLAVKPENCITAAVLIRRDVNVTSGPSQLSQGWWIFFKALALATVVWPADELVCRRGISPLILGGVID